MREIKFRAWHKKEKKMFKVFKLSWFYGIFLIGDENTNNIDQGIMFGSADKVLPKRIEKIDWRDLDLQFMDAPMAQRNERIVSKINELVETINIIREEKE